MRRAEPEVQIAAAGGAVLFQMTAGGVSISGDQIKDCEAAGGVKALVPLSRLQQLLVDFAGSRIVMAIQKLRVGFERVRGAVLRASFQEFARARWVPFGLHLQGVQIQVIRGCDPT